LPRLRQRARHIRYVEAHASWLESYDAVKTKHDAAVEELKQVYPEIVARLVPLLTRIRAIDAEARRVINESKLLNMHGEPYDGLPWLPPVECAARGLSGNAIGGQRDTRLSLRFHRSNGDEEGLSAARSAAGGATRSGISMNAAYPSFIGNWNAGRCLIISS